MVIRYQHTHVARLLLVLAMPAVLLAVALASRDSVGAGLIVAAVGVVLLASFTTLTTIVSDEHVHVRFGVGLLRRSIPLTRIVNATVVRNRWYYGWGIRLTPRGWLWNVSGLDGVELTFADGGHFRIGSDEPERLAAAIQSAIAGSRARPELNWRPPA